MTILQTIEAALAGRLLRAPDALVRRATQRRWEVGGMRLDRRAQFMFLIGKYSQRSMPDMTPEDARRYYARLTEVLDASPPEVVRTVELTPSLGSGLGRGRAYYPPGASEQGEGLPGLVYFHGGGFTIGSIDTHDVLCRRLCVAANCIVMSMNYRLAPEHPFPAAVDDCRDAYLWTIDQATELGLIPGRIGIGGDSAGGNLAAAVAALTHGSRETAPIVQLLIYPSVGTIDHPGRKKPGLQRGYGLDAETTRWFFENYSAAGGASDPRFAPLLLASHRGLPPAIIATAHFDLLCGEGVEYVAKLEEADVPVAHLHFTDLPHGFATMSVLPRAREAIGQIADSLRTALHG